MDKELNLVRRGTRNMLELVGNIPPQGGQPTYILIVRNTAYTAQFIFFNIFFFIDRFELSSHYISWKFI